MLGVINEHIDFQGTSPISLASTISFSFGRVFSNESCLIFQLFQISIELFIFLFTVSPGQPSSISDDAEAVTLVGSGQDAANLINQKEIHWGVSG